MSGRAAEQSVVGYAGGTASAEEIQEALPDAWRQTLADPEARKELTAALGLEDGALDEAKEVPFRVRQARANIDPAVVHMTIEVLTWIGLEVFAKGFADLAK